MSFTFTRSASAVLAAPSSRDLHVSQQLVKVSVSCTPSDFNRLLSFLFLAILLSYSRPEDL